MMIKRRIDEDFKHVWAINWNGLPEDFSDATEIVLTASVYGKKKQLERGIDYVIEDNLIIVDFTPRFATITGIYNLELKYIKPSDGFIDGERRSAIDIDVVQIVARSSQVTDTGDITSTSEAAFGFQGLSAYEVWLKDNPGKTKEDYFAFLQKPATDAIGSIQAVEQTISENEGLRVSAESERDLAEGTRIQAESERLAAEIIRQSNEDNRIENETTRVQNEAERISKEGIRQSNETDRVEAESERVQAESERAQAEVERQTTIQEAVTATNLANEKANLANIAAQNANEAADSALTATQEATTAASLADTARLAIQDDLAIKANQTDLAQLESDVEQLAFVKIKNEVVNGNLENGSRSPFSKYDSFGGVSTLDINSSTPISGNYDIRFTITTPATATMRPIFNGLHRAGNIGDKIYLHFYAKILSGTPEITAISNGRSNSTIYRGNVINGRNTRIIDVTGIDAAGLIYFDSMSAWDMQMDNFMRINLTETFGAGNEPTKEEMDLLISTLGIDYFEGEIIIPAQKIMQWQLKLIRKNKNAIIALGGTII